MRPTNFELVGIADAIVVARAETRIGKPEDESDPSRPQVRFRVASKLKGAAPETLELSWAQLGRVAPGDPGELLAPHPQAMQGGCTRYLFSSGKSYVLFLVKHEDGSLHPMTHPFTRVNEDYNGEASLWVRTIREYLEIQQLAPMEQLAELERRYDRLEAQPVSRERDQRMADIRAQLLSRSPYQPTDFLIGTYEQLARGEIPPADRRFSPKRYDTPDEQRRRLLLALVKDDHPSAAPFFEALIAKPDRTPAELGAAIRFFADHGQMRRAYDLFLIEGMPRLPILPDEQGLALVWDTIEAMQGRIYQRPRWKDDPHLATVWPETALSLYWLQQQLYGGNRAFPVRGAITAIPINDYRDRPKLTLALAETHDKAVRDWAIRELMDETVRTTWEGKVVAAGTSAVDFDEVDNPARLPVQVLVVAFGEERDAAIERVYCQSGPRRDLLIETIGDWGDRLDAEWLARFAADPTLDSDDRRVLSRAAARLYSRTTAYDAPTWFFGATRGLDEMKTIVGGGKLDAKPIKCPSTAH